jgi:hypothetical protein
MTPKERAQNGIREIEQSIVDLLSQSGEWMSRPDIADRLDIESWYKGGHGGYLSGGICKTLVNRGVLDFKQEGPRGTTYYRTKVQTDPL